MKKQSLITPQKRSMFESGYRVMQGEQEFVTYREDTTIRVWFAEVADHYSEHVHSSVEIVLPHQGVCNCVIGGTPYAVRGDEVLFIPSNVPHSLSMPEGSVRNLILFDLDQISNIRGFSAFQEMIQAPIYLQSNHPLCGEVRTQLFAMMEQYYDRPALVNLICYDYLLRIYIMLGQDYLCTHRSSDEDTPKREENSWAAINRVLEYVNQNYAEPITLDSISQVAGFSKYYFSRLFSKYTSSSFSHYLLRKRISIAAQLLCSTKLPIVQVSIQSGFSSLSTFNRTFKDIHGCTPTEYRAIYEKELSAAEK